MASSPVTSWQIEGGKVEEVTDFIFLVSKITAHSDCSCEIKRHLLLKKKSYDKPRQCFKKQRHHFADKGHYNHCPQLLSCLRLFEAPLTVAAMKLKDAYSLEEKL